MKVHSMKLAQALPNQTSLLLFSEPSDKRTGAYDIVMADRGYFEVTDKRTGEFYLVFPANCAWVKIVKEEEKKPAGKPKKGE